MGYSGLMVAVLAATAPAQDGAGQTANCSASGCHASVQQHQRVHEPVATNRCDTCHEPKPGATPFEPGPRHEFKRAGDNPELCYACHDRLGQERFVHPPVEMGVCILCHDPHGSEHGALLRVDTDRKLCGQCHRVTVDQSSHVHPPVADGTCGACHNPHGSDQAKFLRAAPPELCLDCHEDIEDALDDASSAHDVVTTGRACLNCHDPHGSKIARLLVAQPMALCLSCHNEELDSNGGRIRNIARYLEARPDHHGPIRDENCTACHNPHGGAFFRLLALSYPRGLSAPYDEDRYALCLDCHDVEMVEEERDEEATEFRNGDLNLHFLHVNRKENASTCGACHDVHAGSDPKHMADSPPPGERLRMTNFVPTETGGSCTTLCHTTRAYDRDDPVNSE